MINSELANLLLTLYVMYGCFVAGKVSVGIRAHRAHEGLPVHKPALLLIILITIFLWAPIMLLGGRGKGADGEKSER